MFCDKNKKLLEAYMISNERGLEEEKLSEVIEKSKNKKE